MRGDRSSSKKEEVRIKKRMLLFLLAACRTVYLNLSLVSAVAALPALPRSVPMHFLIAGRAGFCDCGQLF
jgi:hypothetical protein